MRRYFLAGLAMHPTAEMRGRPDRRALPRSLPGRSGDEGDLELVAEVEAHLGRSRTEDVAFGLCDGRCRIDVVDSGPGRGWVLWHSDRPDMLGATDDQTAAVLPGGSSPALRERSWSTVSLLLSSGRSKYSIRPVSRRKYVGPCSLRDAVPSVDPLGLVLLAPIIHEAA